MNTQMQWAVLDNPSQPNITTGETVPCVERGRVRNVIFVEMVRHGAGSWFSLCSGSPTEITAFPIVDWWVEVEAALAKGYEPE